MQHCWLPLMCSIIVRSVLVPLCLSTEPCSFPGSASMCCLHLLAALLYSLHSITSNPIILYCASDPLETHSSSNSLNVNLSHGCLSLPPFLPLALHLLSLTRHLSFYLNLPPPLSLLCLNHQFFSDWQVWWSLPLHSLTFNLPPPMLWGPAGNGL